MSHRLRVTFIASAFVALTSCTVRDTRFVVENGLCYRIRTTSTWGCQTSKVRDAAVPENCGLPKTTPSD